MTTGPEIQKLLEATERNTHAVRALAFFFVSYFYQKLLGVILIIVGLVLVASNPYLFSWAWLLVVAGPILLLIFVFASISDSLSELKASGKPSSGESPVRLEK
jgi:hypothetical protein